MPAGVNLCITTYLSTAWPLWGGSRARVHACKRGKFDSYIELYLSIWAVPAGALVGPSGLTQLAQARRLSNPVIRGVINISYPN